MIYPYISYFIVHIYNDIMYIIRATSWQRHIIFCHTITVFLISRHWSPGNSQIETLVSQRALAHSLTSSLQQATRMLALLLLFQIVTTFRPLLLKLLLYLTPVFTFPDQSLPGKH